ncbi:hypothetical protein RUM44_007882 [Polyplax serrata]|uniref:Uncharacterized protein n=1 Tax=Polyplax serrata TaxID=468196 RepID=A0ABR1BB70_POLSC
MDGEDKTNSTSLNLFRTILLGLCANFNDKNWNSEEWNCTLRQDTNDKLKSLNGKTLRLTTLQRLPLSGTVRDENGKLHGVGVAFDLIHAMQEKYGFLYNITLPREDIIGNENSGIIQMVKNKEVDLAVTFIPIITALREIVSYSVPLSQFEWVLLMARPTASASQSGLLAPFQGEVWVCILISLIIAGPVFYLITYIRARFERKRTPFQNIPEDQYTLNSCYWFAYGALMKQGSTLSPEHDSPRLFFATWWIFITILTSFYTANLTAFLTLSHFTLTIQTTEDIYRNHRHWMTDRGGYEQSLIDLENSFDYLKETIPKYGRFVKNPVYVRLQDVLKGEIYIAEKRKAKKMISLDYMNKTMKNVPEKKRCSFVLAPKSALAKSMAFAFSKKNKYRDILNPVLQQFVSAGIITHLLESNLPLPNICPLDLPNGERKLLNSDLATTYKVVFIGFATALLAFIGEMLYRHTQKNINQRKLNQPKDILDDYKSYAKNLNNLVFVNEQGLNEHNGGPNYGHFPYEYYKEITPFSYHSQTYGPENYLGLNKNGLKPRNVVFQFVN